MSYQLFVEEHPTYEFIELFAPQLPRGIVERAVVGAEGSRYEL